MANIAYYGSHNAAIAVEQDNKIVCVVEIERFVGYKNGGTAQYKVLKHKNITSIKSVIENILRYIKENYGIDRYDTCLYMNSDIVMDNKLHQTHKFIPADNYRDYHHHEAHAGNVFYQSPFNEALVFSFDGGGDDGKFNIYKCTRNGGSELIEKVFNPIITEVGYDLGFAYMSFGDFLGDINYETISEGNLVYSGKIMGLASYGKVRQEWVRPIMDYYKSDPQGPNYIRKTGMLSKRLGIPLDHNNRLTGEVAYDLAATSQYAFEECFLDVARPYFNQYPDMPICLAGGCALNILLNTRLVKEFKRKVFVGPTPNDCGLAVGMLLDFVKPKDPVDITYAGIGILDKNMLCYYFQNGSWWKDELNIDKLVSDLAAGQIVGVMRGRSEHGARALGNRSIICNPFGKEMKDILNQKVKHREWYRPFAPVVRLEDVSKYFEWEGDSRWMSFCPLVKEEWREKLGAITHVDNTARVQTVTKEENEWLYNLLTEFEKVTGVGVLLNTSFNVNRMPILSTCKEALQVFEATEMDGLVIENEYIKKKYE